MRSAPTHGYAAGLGLALVISSCALLTPCAAQAQEVALAEESGARIVIAPPPAESPLVFLIERSESLYRGPVTGETPPEKTEISTLIRLAGKPAAKTGESTLLITFLRVRGAVSGGRLREPVTFDRNTKDAPDGRPETALVGKTIEMDVRRDGRVSAVRGVDEDSTGQASVAISTIADLSTLVTALPATAVAPGDTWTNEQLEGSGLLRRRVTTTSHFDGSWDTDATVEVDGRIAPAPEGAPPAFADTIRLMQGRRRATYRLSLADGLPTVARHVTEFTVEAPLSASGVDVRVAEKTVINVRRRGTESDTPSLQSLAPAPGDETPNTRMPAWIGTARAAVRRQLGDPADASSADIRRFDAYPAFGLVYDYDGEAKVNRITATKGSDGAGFVGRVLGVGLGDRLPQAEALWGRPTRNEQPESGIDVAVFAFDDLTLELDVARAAGTTEPFGQHVAEEILRIRVFPTN